MVRILRHANQIVDPMIRLKLYFFYQIENAKKSDCNSDVLNVKYDIRQITNLTQQNTMYLGRYKNLIPFHD
jgi:hypothetical protein